MLNPFGTTFESLESPSGPVVDSVHEAAYRQLIELIDSGEGQLISLRAPRAGYGKTMLLSRLREKKKSTITIIPIHLSDGRRIEGERVLEEVLTQLTESVPGTAGLTKMDLHARRLFAHGLIPMVYSGEVPSQDKDGALASLRERPTEAFDFHNEGAAIAQWTKSQFEVLSPRLSSVLGKASGASTRDTSYWISRFFDYATRTPNEPSRTGDLMDTVFGSKSRFRSGAGYLDGLGSFLNLITLVEPTVLVLDEVDGLSSDSDSALRTTSSLISLWEAAPRMSVIISVNDDVWESAFAPRLPLGLRDRLEDIVIRLKPLTADDARALVKVRSSNDADKILGKLDLSSDSLYPRGVLKAARDAWNECDFTQEPAKEAPAKEAPAKEVPEKEEPAPTADDSLIKEFAVPKASESVDGQEVEAASVAPASVAPAVAAAPAKPKKVYPPIVVRRVGIPKAFDVQRIRQATPTVPDFGAPAQAAVAVTPGFAQQVSESNLAEPAQTEASPFGVAAETVTKHTPAQNSPFAPASAPAEAAPAESSSVVPPSSSSPFALAPATVPPVEPTGSAQESPFSTQTAQPAPKVVVEEKSPFEVAAPAAKAPFEATPEVANSPFSTVSQTASESQSFLPPVRPSQAAPANTPPVASPAPVQAQADPPVEAPSQVEERRRIYPSNSPFDIASSSTPVQAAPAQAQPASPPPVFAPAPETPAAPAPSPFGANLAPQAVPPQPEVPKADADAIDELLRQFREQRDA